MKVQIVRAYLILVLTKLGMRGSAPDGAAHAGAGAGAGASAEVAALLFVKQELVARRYRHTGASLVDQTSRGDMGGANIVPGMAPTAEPASNEWPLIHKL